MLTSPSNVKRHTENGVTLTFPFDFKLDAASHLVVESVDLNGAITTLSYPADYSVTGLRTNNGGSITKTAAAPDGYGLVLRREVPLDQLAKLRGQREFDPVVVEDALDKLTQIAQQHEEELSRTFRSSVAVGGINTELPPPAPGYVFGWNPAGTGIDNIAHTGAQQTADLASTTNAVKGAGMVGFNAALDYLSETVGFYLKSALAFITSLGTSAGSSLVGFIQAGTGAVARTVQDKGREWVSVKDFGAVGDGVADDTAAFTSAQGSGHRRIFMPAGSYVLDNFMYKQGTILEGEGFKNTYIKQANNLRPAIYVKSDVSTGQLISVGLRNVTVKGLNTDGAPAVKIEAIAPYVVSFSNFDFHTFETSTALEIICGSANEVYSNNIYVYSLKSTSTAFKTKGAYNNYRLEAVLCATGHAIEDASIGSTFSYCVADGSMSFSGQNTVVIQPIVETIYGTAAYDGCAIRVGGSGNVLIAPSVTNCNTSKCSISFKLWNTNTIIQPKVWGEDYPNYSFLPSSTAKTTIIGGAVACAFKMEAHLSADILANQTLIGDVSSFSVRKTGQTYNTQVGTTYAVDGSKSTYGLDTVVAFDTVATCTVTLPSGNMHVGRQLRLHTRAAQSVVSASSNVVPMGGAAGTAILAATAGKWADLIYDGTNWNIVANN